MHLLLLQILFICTSIVAWLTTSGSCLIQIRYLKRINSFAFTIPILATLCAVSTYNLYKVFFLCQDISLIPGFNCWSFTVLIPSVYLYYRFRITRVAPDKKKQLPHLLLPGALAVVYAGLLFISPADDQPIYSWRELIRNFPSCQIIFRMGCYLASILQFIVYAFFFRKNMATNGIKSIFSRKEALFVLCFWGISYYSMLTTNYFLNTLYYSSIASLGGYIMWNLKVGPEILHRIKSCFPNAPEIRLPSPLEREISLLTEKQKRGMDKWLSPETSKSKITQKEIADDVMLDSRIVGAYYRQAHGDSYSNLIKAVRIKYVKEKLLDKDYDSIIQLLEDAGFQSPSSFYETFKAANHVSPIKWQKQNLAKKKDENDS